MQNRAVIMAEEAAARARTPQEFGSIRQRLVDEVQRGTVPPYVGIPLIQDLTQKMTEAQAKMAQLAVNMDTPPAPQGAPIAQQVMAQAQQPAGVDALPSNLPQSYAPGGLVAFADGGEVERYQNEGLIRPVPGVPSYMQGVYSGETEVERLRRERLQAEAQARAARNPNFNTQPTSATPGAPGAPGATPARTPFTLDRATMTAEELGPVPGSDESSVIGGRLTNAGIPSVLDASSDPAAPVAPFFTASRITAPTVRQVTLAAMKEPDLINLKDLVEGAPIEAKNAFNDAVEKEQGILSAMNAPIEQAREAKFAARQAQNEKNAAITTALGIMSTGLGVAGSKERTLAGALGKEGREGIEMLVRGEAANRLATDKLEDARDNFAQQKLATRKGDRATAMAAGQRASDDIYKYQTMNLTAAQAGNAQALQRLGIDEARAGTQAQLTQGANLAQAQLTQGAGIANAQLAQGAAGLGLQAQQLKQTADYQNQQIQMLQKRFEASNAATKAKMAQIQSVAFNKFVTTVEPQLNQELAKQYGPNWRTGADVRSIEAQQIYNLRKQQYMIDALGQSEEQRAFSGARSAEDLLGDS
jgi:hypothetical protein